MFLSEPVLAQPCPIGGMWRQMTKLHPTLFTYHPPSPSSSRRESAGAEQMCSCSLPDSLILDCALKYQWANSAVCWWIHGSVHGAQTADECVIAPIFSILPFSQCHRGSIIFFIVNYILQKLNDILYCSLLWIVGKCKCIHQDNG